MSRLRSTRRLLRTVLLLLGAWTVAGVAFAQTIALVPDAIDLRGPLDFRQLLITERTPDGKSVDLTHSAEVRVEGAAVTVAQGLVRPVANGASTLVVKNGTTTVRVPVTVADAAGPVSFRNDAIAAMSVGGCNMGACHGSPSGKNGFRLSLRGQDPAFDLVQLTRDAFGRRVGNTHPETSLVFLKATGQVAHDGGVRFGATSLAGSILREWMRQGCGDDRDATPLRSLQVLPGSRALATKSQQLLVRATFGDGIVRDVTPLTVFTSSDLNIADVDAAGRVEFKRSGEVAIVSRYLGLLHVVQLSYIEPNAGFAWKNPPENNAVDKLVFAKLRALQLPPSELCTDGEFLRRVTLDLCCRLPTLEETNAFLADASPGKRNALIDRLLEEPTHVDFWTLKWLDVLKATKRNLGPQGLTLYRDWLKGHLAKNTRFDEVVRELMTARGDTYEVGPANYFRVARTSDETAEMTSQLFLGIRIQCAKCHSHPYEKWTQDDYCSQAAFFARIDRKPPAMKPKSGEPSEVIALSVRGEATNPRTGRTVPPQFLAGDVAAVKDDADRRAAFAGWLTGPGNPFFARAVVNRIWFHLMGRGIVEPVDDFRESNPPSHPELLDALARDFAKDFDVKKTIRTILRSRTYQLSARTNDLNRDDVRYFSHANPRMLTAEQLFEAVCDVTDAHGTLPGLPKGARICALADLDAAPNETKAFLKAFNQPARDLACECERATEGSLSQALQVLNGRLVQEKLSSSGRIARLLSEKLANEKILDELYLAAFARLPHEAERSAAMDYVSKASDRRRGWEDVFWAAMTSREFLLQH
jgi:hypothetical protein